MKERLLKYLPKKYHKCVVEFELESGLADDCDYMLYLDDTWATETSFPCFSIKEAVQFVKDYCEVE